MQFSLLNENTKNYTDIKRVFINRGIKENEIDHYTNVSAADQYDPLQLNNMAAGAKLLVKHIRERNDTALVVDCDCDGFTASALLYNFLWKLFPNWVEPHLHWFIHEDKEHGLADKVESLIESGVKLVIIPDAGGGDEEHVKRLKAKDIDCLFIDHHDATDSSYGPGIVINNQHGNYPNRTLSGVGVVYKFCQYFANLLRDSMVCPEIEYYLDLVSVGCVADLMPLQNFETLYYIRNGITNINNPFLKAVATLQEYSINKHGGFDPFVIGFYFAPLINATIRVGNMNEKKFLFMAMLDKYGNDEIPSTKRGHQGEIETRAEQAARMCANIRTRQNKIRDLQVARIEQLIKEQYPTLPVMIAVKIEPSENMDKNILGLIANILMDKYQRPIMLLNHNIWDNTYEGSCRNYPYFPLDDLRGFLENLPGVKYAQGHASAFGLCVDADMFNTFFKTAIKPFENMKIEPSYKVDYIFRPDFNAEIILDIDDCKDLFGQGFPEPYVAIKDIECSKDNTQLLSKDKNPTIKITLPNGAAIMKFKSSVEEYEQLVQDGKRVPIEIVGTCSANYWNGNITPQILVKDWNIYKPIWDF